MKPTALLVLPALVLAMVATGTAAKLPPPSDEAKAKAAEAAAKSAHGGKVEAYKLCSTMDRIAVGYYTSAKKTGKEAKPAIATPACADPGPFVAAAVAATPAPMPAPAPVAAAAKK